MCLVPSKISPTTFTTLRQVGRAAGEQLVGHGTTRIGHGWLYGVHELVPAVAKGHLLKTNEGIPKRPFGVLKKEGDCCTEYGNFLGI